MRKIQNSILLLLFSALSVLSQENDFQTWYSVASTVDFNIVQVPNQLDTKTKRTGSITFKQGYRLRENSSLLSKQFSDFQLLRFFGFLIFGFFRFSNVVLFFRF